MAMFGFGGAKGKVKSGSVAPSHGLLKKKFGNGFGGFAKGITKGLAKGGVVGAALRKKKPPMGTERPLPSGSRRMPNRPLFGRRGESL
jgi:hypothetical protein